MYIVVTLWSKTNVMQALRILVLSGLLVSCGGEKSPALHDKGIGPVKSLVLPNAINQEMAKEGQQIFNDKCSTCHKAKERHVGPAMVGILERRSPEWVMNMILNPDEMVRKNPIAQQLLKEYNGAAMANMHLSEHQARQVLEYFRSIE